MANSILAKDIGAQLEPTVNAGASLGGYAVGGTTPPVQSEVAPPTEIPNQLEDSPNRDSVADRKAFVDAVPVAQPDIPGPQSTQSQRRTLFESSLDGLQTALEVAGVVDPTPFVDLGNAGISLLRAGADPQNAGTHLFNAAVSAVSAIPLVGDIAKIGKYGMKAGGAEVKSVKAATNVAGSGATRSAGGGFMGMLGGLFGAGNGKHAFGGGSGSGGQPPIAPPGGAAPLPGGNGGGGSGGSQQWQMVQTALSTFTQGLYSAAPGLMSLTGLGVGFIALTGVVQKTVDWFKQLEEGNNRLLESNERLAQYSGEMAQAYNKLGHDRVLRDMERSQAMSGSIGRLAEAQSSYEGTKQDLFQPFEVIGTELRTLVTYGATLALKIIDIAQPIDEIAKLIADWIGKNESDMARNSAEAEINRITKMIPRDKFGGGRQ